GLHARSLPEGCFRADQGRCGRRLLDRHSGESGRESVGRSRYRSDPPSPRGNVAEERAVDEPRPTRGARVDDLQEIVHEVRKALLARDESPAGDWVEQTAQDLSSGRTPGWYYPGEGLSFYSVSGAEGFGHVHAMDAPGAVDRAERLATSLLDHLPETVRSINIGFT